MFPKIGVHFLPAIVICKSKLSSATIAEEPVPQRADVVFGMATVTFPVPAVQIKAYLVLVFGSYALAAYVQEEVFFKVTESSSYHSKIADASSPRTIVHLIVEGSEPIKVGELELGLELEL